MKRSLIISAFFLLFIFGVNAQKYLTKTGMIKFYSDSPLEKIEAINRTVKSVLDPATGDFQFSVLMKSFVFEKALMQEHFNEKYVESDKFPNSIFKGKVTNMKEVDLSKEGIHPVIIEGKLTIHGETKQISEKGTFEIKDGKIFAKSKFNLLLSDYEISIPGAVTDKISKTIEVTVDVVLEKVNP